MIKVVVVLLLLFAIGTSPAEATVSVVLYEAEVFQNVVAAGDVLLLARYQLPLLDWQNDTYLQDATCDDAADWVDPCYTSLDEGAALLTLYDGPSSTAGLIGTQQLPRVGHGLAALYFAPGHGVAWGDTTYEMCVEGGATLFVVVPQACSVLAWNASGSVGATPAVIKPILLAMVGNLEQAAAVAKNSFLNIDRITQTGAIFVREAFPVMPFVVGSAFFLGQVSPTGVFAPTPGPLGLETHVGAAAAATDAWVGMSLVAGDWFGVSTRILGGSVFLLAALAVTIFLTVGTGQIVFGAFAGSLVIGVGTLQDLIPVGPVFVVLGMVLVLGGSWLFSQGRVPQ